jgi:TRAP-type C4-dicarboxylate transport system permease small subunit
MKKIFLVLNQVTNIILALCLATMSVLIFGNVVLRYVFDSGITWSEEVSRFLFIWMTFLGAIVALKDNDHLGVDMLLQKLPINGKRVIFTISNLLVLVVLWLVLDGSWKLTLSSMNSTAPATGMPLAYIYGIGVISSIGMGFVVLMNIYRALFQKDSIDELTRMKESEEVIMEAIHNEKKALTGGGS